MISAKYITISNTQYVAVCLYGCFKIWSGDGSRLLFNIPCKVKSVVDKPYAFTCMNQFNENIICGDNYGNIYVVSAATGNTFKGKLIYTHEPYTPTAITSCGDNIIVGFENGDIHCLKYNVELNEIEVLEEWADILQIPCLSMDVMDKQYLAAGFANGEVKVYNLNTFDLEYSIASHLRLISNVKCYKNYIITAGDDCFVNVWVFLNKSFSLFKSIEIPDRMPVGIGLYPLKNNKVELFVTSYDSPSFTYIENLNII
jgi:WD40 repeat protein